MNRPFRLALVTATLALGLAACQTVPPENADLAAARSALSQARANPLAARAAAVELERAQQSLQRAEAAWVDRRDNEETQHLAYVARSRAEVVMALATQAQAEQRIQQAGAERERARLEARTREAEAAQRTARVAQANAQTAQANAQTAQASAQVAQGQAAQSQQEAEAARQRALQSQQQAEAERARAAQQAERATALERDLQSLQARNTQRGLVVTLGDVLFATGRDTLQPGAMRSVQQLATVLRQYPERRVLVEGFTDSQGGEQMNLDLSQRRADAFRRALQEAGIGADRIEVRAHGEAYAVADNGTAAGRQQNRRVEVLFSDTQGRFIDR